MKKVKPLSDTDTQVLCDQLALLLEEHVPLLDACSIIRATYPYQGEFLQQQLQLGRSLSESLQQIVKLPTYGVLLISVAEQATALPDGLRELADLLKERSAIRKNIIQAMFYPVMLLVAAGVLLSVLIIFILPKIRTVYDSVGVPLPLMTKYLFYFGDHFFAIALGALCFSGFLIGTTIFFKRKYQATFVQCLIILSKISFIRAVLSGIWTQSFFKALHTASIAQVPFDRAVSIGLGALPSYLIGGLHQHIVESVRRGTSLPKTLQDCDRNWVFTPYSLALIRLIEYSVPLDRICTIVTALAQRELARRLKLFERISEPAILTLVACVIGGVAFAVLIPLYSLTQHIHVR